MSPQDENSSVQPETTGSPVTVVAYKPRQFDMYQVSGSELDTLASGSSSINSVFFGATFGAAISFLITALTAPLTDRLFALFWALFAATSILAGYFGFQTRQDRVESQKRVREIKEGTRQL